MKLINNNIKLKRMVEVILSYAKLEGECQCLSCKSTFSYKEVNKYKKEQNGLSITKTVCPHCGSDTYELMENETETEEREFVFRNTEYERLSEDHKRKIRMEKRLMNDRELELYMNGYIIEEL